MQVGTAAPASSPDSGDPGRAVVSDQDDDQSRTTQAAQGPLAIVAARQGGILAS